MARAALCCLVEPGNQIVHELVAAEGPVGALDQLIEGDVRQEALRGAVDARLRGGNPHRLAERALEHAERLGARIAIPEDDEWPLPVEELVRLAQPGAATRVDRDVFPPLCLWVRGAPPLSEALDRSVAVIGSRAATGYGIHVATELGYGLADRGWTVVSGGAFGIDAAAHRGALTAGGLTVAILACGMDRPYPLGHAALFDRIAESGLLVTEWPPGAEPFRHRFLVRNRVIAAATRGTVVVEAAARSGARQTLGRAIGLGRRAMVVPGPVTSAMSVGCHELIRSYPQVRLVTSVAHVVEEVGLIGEDLTPLPRGPERPEDRLDSVAAQVLEAVPRRRPIGLDEVAARAGVDIRTAMRQLSLLDQLGLVAGRDGAWRLAAPARAVRGLSPEAGTG
ncbi:MAG TPA: DNA-processing protein DprA [Micromonosporaceae bacterium]|jgi:DNA processing protein